MQPCDKISMPETIRLADLGQHIRDARLRHGLRLRDVADELDVSIPTVQSWEAGRVHIPALRLLEVANVVGLNLGRVSRLRALREPSLAI